MKKYAEDLTVDTKKTIPYYLPVLPEQVPAEEIPFYYTARQSERLDSISPKLYNTPLNWWVIAKANNLASGVVSVAGGTKLFIPNI
jgi:hypothetical protein